MKNNIEKIRLLIERASNLAEQEGLGNIFYNEQYVEVLAASILGHTYNPGQGEDANNNGDKFEYKSINLANKSKGTFQFHWLSKEKLEKYSKIKYFFFILRKNASIEKIYRLKGSAILDDLFLIAKKKGTLDGSKKIHAHKSFSLSTILKKGAILVYDRKNNI